jgi:hypothetical protein
MSRMSENVGASTFRNPNKLQGLYSDNFTFIWMLVHLSVDVPGR